MISNSVSRIGLYASNKNNNKTNNNMTVDKAQQRGGSHCLPQAHAGTLHIILWWWLLLFMWSMEW